MTPDRPERGICINDIAVSAALLVAWGRWPRLVSAWVGLYVLGVAAVKVAALV